MSVDAQWLLPKKITFHARVKKKKIHPISGIFFWRRKTPVFKMEFPSRLTTPNFKGLSMGKKKSPAIFFFPFDFLLFERFFS